MRSRLSVCLFLALALLLPASLAHSSDPIYAMLTVPLLYDLVISPDVARINEAVNQITRAKIGAEVRLVPILYFSDSNTDLRRQAEFTLLSKEGVSLDLINDALPTASRLIPLDDLLAQYGQGIVAAVGESRFPFHCSADGHVYKLPSVSDYVTSQGISMRKDILDKHGLDVSHISSPADLDQLFTTLHALEPDLKLICGYRTGQAIFTRYSRAQLVHGCVFCLSDENPTQLVNYFSTDNYRQIVTYARKWFLAGYMPDNMALQNLPAASLVRAGELFAYPTAYKPGIEYETSLNCATPMVTVPLMKPLITPYSTHMRYWGISDTCANPGKAMQFLNLLYTDAQLVNLLLYGIEGEHYELLSDGTISYPEGVTRDTVGYLNTMPWLMPNQLISLVSTGNDPNIWTQTESYNQSAAFSDILGFTFDPDGVAKENARLNEIVQRYAYGLGSGQLNPDIYLARMQAEMETAGLADVQAHIQTQFDNWMKERGK